MWLPYDELYEVSVEGQVRNRKTGLVLKPWLGGTSQEKKYYCVTIHEKNFPIHRLVAICSLPRIIHPKDEVDHINCNPLDNRACNLRWVSKSINQRNNMSENICLRSDDKRYVVRFKKDKKNIYNKSFKTLEEAIEARDAFKNSEEFRMSM